MRKAIAIDFDGCLCTDVFPAIGQPNWNVINRAKAEQQAGAGLILWTCREHQLLLDAIAACESWGLTFDAVNESLPDWIEMFKTQPRKVGATEYWDDKALGIPTVPNDPLTLEDLKEMDGYPVWREHSGYRSRWVLVDLFWRVKGTIYLCNKGGGFESAETALKEGVKLYRHPPEAHQ